MTNPAATAMSHAMRTASYDRNVEHGETGHECARCGKQIKASDRSGLLVEVENCGFYPIGAACAKALRKLGVTSFETTAE